MSVIGAALAVSYPFFKRFFPLPQFYLGVAFSWGVPMAFKAQNGNIPRVAWIIFFAGIIWAAIYDTMYAMVDREDDLKIGVKSSAIVFGDMDKLIIGMLQGLMLYRAVSGRHEHGVRVLVQRRRSSAAAVFFVYQQWLIRAAQAGGLLPRLPEQSVRRDCRVHRHPARVRVQRLTRKRPARVSTSGPVIDPSGVSYHQV